MIDKKVFFYLIVLFTANIFAVEFENQNSLSLSSTYFSKSYLYADQTEAQIRLLMENKITLNSEWTLKLSPLVYTDYGSKEKKTYSVFDTKESRISFSNYLLSADLGFFNLKKVGPDFMDPLDYFQPRNWQNPLAAEKLSVLGAQVEFEPTKNLTVNAVYVPENRISKLPRNSSSWYPREFNLPLSSSDTVATLPLDAAYVQNSSTVEKKSDLKSNYLVRAKYSIQNLDAYLQIAESVSIVPLVTPTLTGTLISINPTEIILQNPIQLDSMWKKNKNYGGGLVYGFSDYGLITKFFYNLNVTPDDENAQSVIAFEKQFENTICIYEYSKSQKKNTQLGNQLAAANSVFSNAHAIAVRWSVTEIFKLKLGSFFDADSKGSAVLIGASYSINDNLTVDLQHTEIVGTANSLMGIYQNNDLTTFKITTLF